MTYTTPRDPRPGNAAPQPEGPQPDGPQPNGTEPAGAGPNGAGIAGPSPNGEVEQRITAYWNERSASYDVTQRRQLEAGALRDAWREVWQAALPPAPATVLDVGTGTGQVALLLAELGYDVTGVDLAEAMLAVAGHKADQQGLEITFGTGSATDTGFGPASFDAVASRYLLWTLPDPQAALRHWRELLPSGGRLVVVDSAWFPSGLRSCAPELPEPFLAHYAPELLAQLPLVEAPSIQRTCDAVAEAGYADVQASELSAVHAAEHAAADELDHALRVQYVITATAP